MKLTVYHLKSCDTCRKALKALAQAGHSITAVDVRADGVPKAVLEKAAQAVGWQALLNTRSTTWRGLGDAEKSDMTEAKALALMAQHPTLIKRPLIIGAGIIGAGIMGAQTGAGITGTQTTVGWTKVQQELWLN